MTDTGEPMAMPLIITDTEFDQAVLAAEGLVLVDFWATYCPNGSWNHDQPVQ